MLLDVPDVVVGDQVADAVMAFLRVEFPAHLLRAQPTAVELVRVWIIGAFGRVEEADVEFGAVGDDGQWPAGRPDVVEPLMEAQHRGIGGGLVPKHAVADACESADEFRQWTLRVDQLLEPRPCVLVARRHEQCADLDDRGSFLGMESRGFRVKHHVRVERLVEWFDATWIISVDVAIPIHVLFPFTGSVLSAGSVGWSHRFPSGRSPGVIRPRGHAGRRRGWPG